MNRIYRIIRSRTYNRDVVVSEITKTRGKSSGEARTQARNNPFFRSLLSGLLAVGLTGLPAFLSASEITRLDGGGYDINGNVHNLYAGKINSSSATGAVGVSKYGKFTLTQGDIANMHFNTKDAPNVHADILVNLVNDRINIGGTVNALKNNRVGGHLYFLSPNGMAVSSSGVINAGQFTAIVPTTKLFETLRDGDAATFNQHFFDYVMEKGKIGDLSDWYSVDNSQDIRIEGTINTRSGIKLRASKIDIVQGAKLLSNRQIDFSSLVNTTDFGGLSNVTMTATADDTTGDIILKAGVESYADDSLLPETSWPGYKTTTRQAFINVDGAIETDGNVEIGAEAKTTFTEGSLFNILSQTDIVGKILGAAGINMMADWADKSNTTHVTIGEYGSIKSGGDTDISATNKTAIKLYAVTPAKKTGEAISAALPVISVGVVNQKNNALVDVYGNIDSGSDLSLKASADTSIVAVTKSATEVASNPDNVNENDNLIYISVGVIDSNTSAAVNLHEGKEGIAGAIKANGQVDIGASVSEDVSMEVESSAPDKSVASTGIGIIDSDTDATVTINRSIEAKGQDTRKAKDGEELSSWVNIFVENKSDNDRTNTLTVTNELGGIKYEAAFKPAWMEDPGIVDSWLDPLMKSIQGKLSAWRYGGEVQAGRGDVVYDFLRNIGSYVKAGASVAVVTQDNTAKIVVGDGVTIDAGEQNDISLDANVDMDGLNVVSEGVGNNQKNEQETKVMVAVGVAGSDIKNTALVSIGKEAALIGKDVSIAADANMYYNPVKDTLNNVAGSWKKVWGNAEKIGADLSSIKEIDDKLKALQNIDDPTQLPGKLTEIKTMGSSKMDAFLDSVKDAGDAYVALKLAWEDTLSLLDPATYTNYYARAEVANTKQGDESSKLDVAGAINIGLLHNEAVVSMAEGARVGAKGDSTIHAGTKTQTVAITGSGGKYLQSNESGRSGAGVSLAIQNITGDSLVLMGKNTAVSGENITIESDNLMKQWGIVYGAGEAGTVGFTGTINVMNGDSNSIVSIDDEAELSGAGKVDIKAKNDSTVLAIAGGATLGNDSSYASAGFGLDVINYDVNTIVVVADNAADGKSGSGWLTDAEKATAASEAASYRDDYRESVEKEVDQDIEDNVIASSDRAEEIERRLKVVYDARLEELEKEMLVDKTAADKVLEVEVKRAKAVNLAREMAKEVAIRTYDGTEAELSSLDLTASLGSATESGNQGAIKTKTLNVSAVTDGTINSLAIEGSYSASEHSGYDKYNQFMKRSKASSFMSDFLPSAVSIPVSYLNKKLGGKIRDRIGDAGAAAGGGNDAGADVQMGINNVDLHIAAAGSLAINQGDGMTFAMVDNTTIQPLGESSSLDSVGVKSEDSLFAGAWAGGAAINAHTGAAAGGSREYSAGIALAYNAFDRDVTSLISNTAITEAGAITNTATRKGAEASLGIGLAVSKGQADGTEGSIGVSVSYDRSLTDVHAVMVNDTVTGKETTLENTAYNQDIQVAGGVDFAWTSGGDDGVGAGGTATISRIKNSLQGGIYGGTYTNMEKVDVQAVKSSLQVNVAVAGAVSTEETAKDASFALAFGQVDNDSQAFIRKASITSSGDVRVEANDTANESSYQEYLKKRGVDYEGTSYLGDKGAEIVNDTKGGSKVVNVAIGFDKSGAGGGSVAGSINDLTEKMKVDVTDSTITADRLVGQADSKTSIVDVAAGVAVAGDKFNGAGSFSWNDLDTENTVTFANDSVHADQVYAIANNQANIVGIAGELGFGKGVAAGLALAVNSFDSTTSALIQGGSYQAKDGGGTLAMAVDAQNRSDVTAVAFGGQISTESSAWNGVLAINVGDNNTEAAIETAKEKDDKGQETETGTKLADAGSIKVSASDTSTRRTGAGDLTWSNDGVVAVGAAIAYSEIGGTSVKSGEEKEILRAEIKGADITTKRSDSTNPVIDVSASDTSKLTTAGVGLGIGMGNDNKLNAQGAAAAGVIAKKTTAAITNTKIDTGSAGSKAAEVTVQSTADNYIGSGGVAAVGSFGSSTIVSAGIGLGINKIGNATIAQVSGSTMNVNELLVKSDAISRDVGVAVGFSGSAGTVSLAGSFNYNTIGSSATAEVKDSTVTSEGNIGVVAKSDELIDNYAGAISFTVGGEGKKAAIGASVAVNEIDGDTVASVSDSTLTAKGNTDRTVALKSKVSDDAIISGQATLDTFDAARLKNARSDTARTGVVVDASASHAIASDLATAGAAVSSNGAAVALTFNENYIAGKTEAAVTRTDINKDAVKTQDDDNAVPDVGTKQDIIIAAADYANIGAFEVGLGGSMNVSVGATQNTNNAKRTVTAKLEGEENNRATVNAHNVDVRAVSKQGLSNLGLAGALALKGVSASANILNDTIDTTTQVSVRNADIGFTDRVSVNADNLSRAYIGTYDLSFTAKGGALGAGIGLISQTSKVFADVSNAVISDHKISSPGNASAINIGSSNTVDTGSYFAALAVAGYGGAASGTFTYNDFDAEVGTTVNESTLKADTVDVSANEDLYAENYGANVGGGLFVGVGINSTGDTVHDKVYTKVTGSTLEAVRSLAIGAEARRDLRQTVANVAGGAAAVGVNLQHTYINEEISDQDMLDEIKNANSSNEDMTGYFAGLDDEGKAKIRARSEYTIGTGSTTDMTGVHTIVSTSTLKADQSTGSVNVSAVERNRVESKAGSGGGGAVSVVTTVSAIEAHQKTDVALESTDVSSKNIMIRSVVGDNKKHVDGYTEAINAGKTEEEVEDSHAGLYALTGVGNVGAVAVTPATAKVESTGTSGISLKNTGITGDTVTLSAADVTNKKAHVTAVTVGAIGVNIVNSEATDKSAMNISLEYDQTKTIKADSVLTVDAQKMNTVVADSVGVGVSAAGAATNQATATDKSTVNVSVKGKRLIVDAAQANFSAMNAPSLSFDIDNHGFSVISGFYSNGTAKAESSAIVDIAASNTFNVDRLSFKSRIGEQDRTTVSGELASVSVGGIDFSPDKGNTETKTVSRVTVGGQTYKQDEDGNAMTDLTVSAANEIEHANKTWMMDIHVLDFSPNGAAQGYATSNDSVSATVGGGLVKTAAVTASGNAYVDNYVSGNGGALIGIGVASKAVNAFDNSATVTVGGEWQADEFNALALQRDQLESETFSGHGGALDVTWVEAENTMKGKSLVSVADNAGITADTVDMKAENRLYTNQSGKYANRVHGVVGGIGAGTIETSDETVEKTAEINIGKNVNILTTGQQRYEADTETAMNNAVTALAAGLFEGGTARVYNTHTYSNLINVGEGALLKNTGTYEDGGITLSVHEDLFERVNADVSADGFVGIAPNSKAQNYTTRNDRITIEGTLDSARDIGLYAGADLDGALSSLQHETVSEAYNNSVIPAGWSTDPDAKITGNYQVTVTGTGTGKAVRNINIIADSGQEEGYLESKTACLYTSTSSDKKMLTVKDGKSNYTRNTDNFAKVETGGLLQAGVKSKVKVEVEGVAVPEGTIDGKSGSGGYTVSILDAEGNHLTDLENQVRTGTMDYANVLSAQWFKLGELLEAYEGKNLNEEQLTAYSGYLLEKKALEEQMTRLGLMKTVTDDKGISYSVPAVGGYSVTYVEMPDELVASGGNITVNSDNLYGGGQLKADGYPSITVNNTSNAYLKLNKMTIGDDGGGIVFRDIALDEGDKGIQKINADLNKNKSYSAAFSEFKTGKDGDSGISVINENIHGDISATGKNEQGETVTETYSALSTVEVAGAIQGSRSKVQINNKSGSIIIDSGTTENPVSINGKEIVLTARDDISQGFTDGMVNIGYTPEAVLASLEKTKKESTETYKVPTSNKHEEVTADKNTVDGYLDKAETGGRINGGSIYLAASAININGLIQSGFETYSADITETDLQNAITASKSRTGGVIVNGQQMYKVNDGGMKKGDNGIYSYVVQVYYDPSTGGLVAEDIDTKGGKVYLSGRILSTGQGKIMAMDGGATITIKNDSSAALQMGKVLNNDIDGVIEITDTLKNTRTTYTRSDTTTINDYREWLKAPEADKARYVVTTAASDVYKPKENVRYNWTDGTETTTKTTYQTDKTKFLSIVKTDEENISNEEKSAKDVNVKTVTGGSLPDGSYLSEGNSTDAAYILIADNRHDSESRSSVDTWTEWHFLNKHYYSRWTKTTGTTQTYVNSLVADKPITIGFLGNENGSIAVSSVKDINLSGNIRNNSVGATLTVGASSGSISQQAGTTIFGNHADLTAKGEIENINIDTLNANNAVKLNMVSQEGATTANVVGNVEIKNMAAGVGTSLAADTYGTQKVVLTTTGNITQSAEADAYGVRGQRIDLTSSQGGIGVPGGQALKVQVGQYAEGDDPLFASINVKAAKDISLVQGAGDMRIGTIAATDGDVFLTASTGTFIDALPYGETENNADTDALVQRWIDLGLIAGEGDYTRKLAQDVENYESSIEKSFAEYTDLKAYFSANPNAPDRSNYEGAYDGAYEDAVRQYQLMKTSYETMGEKFGGYDSVEAYLASDNDYKALVDKRDNPTYLWTKEQMLYAVRNSIVNKDTGSTDQETKLANVSGRNITLKGMEVGIDKDSTEEITVEMLDNGYRDATTGKTYVDYLKTLANADAADVAVEYVKDENGNILKQRIPVYQQDATGKVVLDDNGDPVIDHYKDGDSIIEKFIIGGKVPLGIHATGIVNVETTNVSGTPYEGDVYIASRNKSETEQAVALNIGQVKVQDQRTSNVRLYGKAGVYNALENTGEGETNRNTANVIAHDLIVEGGSGTIGLMDDRDFTVDLGGNLTARADGSIYIRNVNSELLKLASVRSADTVSLTSDKGIVMGDVYDDLGYINAKKGLSLSVDPETGIIGSSDKALRILNTGTVIEITADSANIHGVTGGDSDTMKLGIIKTKSFFAASSEDSIAVNGSLVAGGDVVLEAAEDVKLDAGIVVGAVDKQDNKKLTIIAENGSITQTEKGAITADAVKTVSGKAIALDNEDNHFASYTASGITPEDASEPGIDGSVTVKTHGGDDLKVAFDSSVNGNVAVSNLDEAGGLTLTTGIIANGSDIAQGQVSLTAGGDLTTSANTPIQAASDINLTSYSKGVVLAGGVRAGKDFNVVAGTDISIDAAQTITENLNMTAKGAVEEGTNGSVMAKTVNASVGKGINLAQGSNRFGTFTAQGLVQEDQSVTDIDGDVQVKTNGTPDLTVAMDSIVKGNVSISNLADNGHLVLTSSITARKTDADGASGKVYLESGADLTTDASTVITSDDETELVSNHGDVALNGGVHAGEKLIATAGKDIVINEALIIDKEGFVATAGNSVYETENGSIKAKYVGTATGGTVDLRNPNNALSGFMALGIQPDAQGELSLAETINGDILIKTNADELIATLWAGINGDVEINNLSDSGKLNLLGGMTVNGSEERGKEGHVMLTAGSDISSDSSTVAKSDIRFESINGNITVGINTDDKTESTDGSVIAQTGKGNITINGTVLAEDNGDILATVTGDGDIHFDGNVDAGNNIIASLGGAGDVIFGGTVNAGRRIEASTVSGDISFSGSRVAGSEVEVLANNGNITVSGEVFSTTGGLAFKAVDENMSADAGKGSITFETGSALTAATTVELKTTNGNITMMGGGQSANASIRARDDISATIEQTGNIAINGKLESDSGSISLAAENGSICTDGDIDAGKNVSAVIFNDINTAHDYNIEIKGTVDAGNDVMLGIGDAKAQASGNISILGDVRAGMAEGDEDGGDVTAIILGKGNIMFNGDVDAGTDVLAGITGAGNIRVSGDVDAKGGEVDTVIVGDGNITFDHDVMAKTDVIASVTKGNIAVNQAILAETGNIRMTAEEGDVTVSQDLLAGKEVGLEVGKGNISINDAVYAETGDVWMKAKEGDITVGDNVTAKDGSIYARVGKGHIVVGESGQVEDKRDAVTAKHDIELTSGEGTITVYGVTRTTDGDISMSAASSEYEVGENGMNIIIDANSSITSGRDVSLTTTNGDIHVTKAVTAKRDLNAETVTEGSVYFDTDLQVDRNITVATEKGDIHVGHNIQAGNAVSLTTVTGNVAVGIRNESGDLVGDGGNITGSSVTIAAGKETAGGGDIDIVRKINATAGSVDISTVKGNILIGDNGENVDTVHAAENISFKTGLGTVTVLGETETGSGDIFVSALSDSYPEGGTGQNNIIIDQNGEIRSGRSVTLDATNGDVHVTDDIIARQDLNAYTHQNGSITFETGVDVAGQVKAGTDNGNIDINKSVEADGDVSMQIARKGNIDISKVPGHTVTSTGGSITMSTGEGYIRIGNNGPDVDTVKAQQDISLTTGLGKIEIYGKTSTDEGDISLAAASSTYTPGKDGLNIVIDHNGQVASGRNVNMTATNGDIHITDRIKAARELNAQTHTKGSVLFDTDLDVDHDVRIATDEGDVKIGKTIKATGDISVQVAKGTIDIGKTVTSTGGSIDMTTDEGNIRIGDNGPDVDTVTAKQDINLATGLGKIEIYGKTATEKGDISMSAASSAYIPGDDGRNIIIGQNGRVVSGQDVNMTATKGDIRITDAVTAKRSLRTQAITQGSVYLDADIAVKGDVQAMTDNGSIIAGGKVNAVGNVTAQVGETGDVVIQDVVAGKTADLETRKGDIFSDSVIGNRVIILAGDNTKASHVGTVTANTNGNANGTGQADVVLGGNYVNVDTVQTDSGSAPLTIATRGAVVDQPVKEFNISSLRSDTGTVMQNIWAETGDIHVDTGNLHISKIYAVDKLHVDNDTVSVAVFGTTPRREGETVVLWNNLNRNQPGSYLADWYNGSYKDSRWVFLDLFAGKKVKAGNGVVIDYRDYPYFYGSHNSVVNVMGRYLTSEMYGDRYDIAFFNRYAQIQFGDGFEQNATVDEITVE